MKKDILITGIPRSGTTLLTSLISQNSKYVVFSEPDWLKQIRANSNNSLEFCESLKSQINHLRKNIDAGKPVQLKTSKFNAGLPTNYYLRDDQGKVVSDKSEKGFVLPLHSSNQPFVIKANAQFSACLNGLVNSNQYQIVCVIRNPVATIMSWRSLQIPVSKGHMKIAEKYADDFNTFTHKATNLLEKQVLIADWFFKQFTQFRDNIKIISYENMVSNTTEELSKAFSFGADLKLPPLSSQNKNKHYNLTEYNKIKNCMLKLGYHYKQYYPQLTSQ